jgi:DNA replicative helicase MCM subunit Mcm2 (Cdc46/Mcm family)
VPDAATIDRSFARKLAGTVRLLTSNKPNEVDAARQALLRILQVASKDMIFGIAERIENESNGHLDETELKQVFEAGVEHGKKLSAQAQAQTQQAYPQMPSAYTMAAYCFERMKRLDDKHHEFIEKMMRYARRYPLSPKQQTYLEDLYLQLGGSI